MKLFKIYLCMLIAGSLSMIALLSTILFISITLRDPLSIMDYTTWASLSFFPMLMSSCGIAHEFLKNEKVMQTQEKQLYEIRDIIVNSSESFGKTATEFLQHVAMLEKKEKTLS